MEQQDSRLSVVLDALTAIAQAPSLDEYRRIVVEQLRALVPCEMAAYNEVSLVDGTVEVTLDPPDRTRLWGPETFARHMHEHPVLAAHRRGELQAAAISDFLTEPQFHRLNLYQAVFEPLGFADQLSLTLEVGQTQVTAVALNRSTWGFTDEERSTLDLITPNIAQARHNVIAHERTREEFNAAVGGVDALGIGLVTLDRERSPQSWSPRALELLHAVFDHPASEPPTLPPPVRDWLEQADGADLVAVSDVRNVRITLVHSEPGGRKALIVREREPVSIGALTDALGVTERQAEVLSALMEGATNDEIAERLDLSPRTIQKHVGAILATLGVRTRTAAAARAREALD